LPRIEHNGPVRALADLQDRAPSIRLLRSLLGTIGSGPARLTPLASIERLAQARLSYGRLFRRQAPPKFLEIFAADFRDCVVHHVLVEGLERIWEPIFLHDSYACRKGKGTHRAVTRPQQFMRRVTHNGTKPGFALQLDIRGFFFHIDKERLFQIIAKRLWDETLLWLARTIIFHDCTEQPVFKTDRRLWRHIPPHKTLFGTENRRGLPIGNLTSQFFSNVYLNELDQFEKHRLKVRHYLRYSDDFVLVHEDPA
jgi:RNA-directed DNA polymerase